MISSSQRPLPDNTQHSQQTNIHAPGGIRTHNRSRRVAADLRLRPRGYWDWQTAYIGATSTIRLLEHEEDDTAECPRKLTNIAVRTSNIPILRKRTPSNMHSHYALCAKNRNHQPGTQQRVNWSTRGSKLHSNTKI